jgi:hypothetical protein
MTLRNRTLAAVLATVLVVAATAGQPAAEELPSVDALLARLFSTDERTPYELTAEFTGTLTLTIRGGAVTARAAGSFYEVRRADGVRRRRVQITRLDLPFLLRPFASTIRRVIEEQVETQNESPETFHAHDIFLHSTLPGKRYVLVGVHKEIVDEAIDRYGRREDKADPATRRRIAQWLYTTPTQRELLVRPGPPYALRAVLNEYGTLFELALLYHWGEIGTRIDYAVVRDQWVWRQVDADASSELAGFGRVDGKLRLTFFNHCLNCPPARPSR